jgi:putative two-component system response regulator
VSGFAGTTESDHSSARMTVIEPRATPVRAASPRPSAGYVLIVDDEPQLRRVLSRLMLSDGFEVDEATNGREALDALQKRPATLVLSDLYMPELDGMELLREVRAQHPDTAVIMITAVTDVSTAVHCLSLGAMDYITKPFHLEEIRARVRQALERRRLLLENRDYQERLEERVAQQAHRLEQLFLASIQSLADALEVKDRYTHGHSVRVAKYMVAIAQRLGLTGDTILDIELGGRVHDIGKIGVREDVLSKAGPLTDDEYAHVMTHPMVGWRILQPLLRENPRALNVVRSHHERFDGRGIPDGLAGETIPIEARIAAVADTFDAMTSARPYRPGLSLEATQAELKRCSGSQLDPQVVQAFLGLVAEGKLDDIMTSNAESVWP